MRDIVGTCNHIVMTRHTQNKNKKKKMHPIPAKPSCIGLRIMCPATSKDARS
jgi:hypothetical protein